ncbi:40S ribosomal protein S19 [Strongyloides ratti]|uniref:40S ribosomal protein S19 n=1 Tax=Strongyloides ratti TaxID=34506 RepID=A0A090LD65_STRRB|nr:40S ribosomal protein S19 [Strongyloides ratti]CEF67682.1 40S ribosomal protein S19 [Strongyloides ratti]
MGVPTLAKDVNQSELVKQVAAFLKKSGKVAVPENSDIIKLGRHKELAPMDADWYFTRAASLARRLYLKPGVGVGALKRSFGGNKRRGVKPRHFQTAAGGNIRKALQALETINWVEKSTTGGRLLTAQGRKDLDRIASQMRNRKSE